jgi:tryptophan 2,3-dioxygenase
MAHPHPPAPTPEPAQDPAAHPGERTGACPGERAGDLGDASPHLDFAGSTPYEDYVHADVLTHLQQPRSDDPGELAFLVTTQVMELWFTALVHEWETAGRALARDDLAGALAALKRSTWELEALCAAWKPLAHLTPAQFNAYRATLGEGSGFQSAMYRRLEFLLGEKSAAMLVPHRGTPRAHAELEKALAEPGLYDEALRYLHRHGVAVPVETRERDFTARYEPHPGVEAAWARVYASEADAPGGDAADPSDAAPTGADLTDADLTGPADATPGADADAANADLTGPLALGEALTEVAELVWRWRNDHLVATRRAMGAKAGTGGSAGVAWLEKRAAKQVFPELWTARSHV